MPVVAVALLATGCSNGGQGVSTTPATAPTTTDPTRADADLILIMYDDRH